MFLLHYLNFNNFIQKRVLEIQKQINIKDLNGKEKNSIIFYNFYIPQIKKSNETIQKLWEYFFFNDCKNHIYKYLWIIVFF